MHSIIDRRTRHISSNATTNQKWNQSATVIASSVDSLSEKDSKVFNATVVTNGIIGRVTQVSGKQTYLLNMTLRSGNFVTASASKEEDNKCKTQYSLIGLLKQEYLLLLCEPHISYPQWFSAVRSNSNQPPSPNFRHKRAASPLVQVQVMVHRWNI